MSNVKLIAITQGAGELVSKNAQEVISYIARVSNPNNQLNFDTASGLLKYCIKHEHWSIFEQAYMTLEINTTRGIAAQILRHRSFTFQEFSQRYADTTSLSESIEVPELRRQDTKNRQNSTDDLPVELIAEYDARIKYHFDRTKALYDDMIQDGIAKECARFVLPIATPTKIYMTGSARSWIHYINLRSAHGTQKEHMDIAEQCRCVFIEQFPSIAEALQWTCNDQSAVTIE
ncbi:thymidylate synthase [Synechococcus phage DSL-LC03]|nr:thymidylate synthase [Synechococcus phage DSL-LC03]